MTATDAATEVVADAAEEVSEHAQHVADVAREASGRGLGLAVGAFLIGTGVGGGLAYLFAIRRLETKYSQIAEVEIEEMREHYLQKAVALEAQASKEDLKEIVEERGYSSTSEAPPMAVSPPAKVVEDAKETLQESQPEAAKVIKEPQEHAEVRNVFVEHGSDDTWDYAEEKKKRSPDIPYVIHYDERDEMDYQVVTLTYYEADDVVCNERDEIFDPARRDEQVGEKNLEKFGHGSNDPSVVYVRNDKMELVYEVVRSPNSYAEEVHGLKHSSYSRNLERMRAREREQISDDGD